MEDQVSETARPTDTDEVADSVADEDHKIEPDWLLRHYIYLANRFGVGISITLTVNGTIICGAILPGQEYFKRIADIADQAWSALAKKSIDSADGKAFRDIASQYKYYSPHDAQDDAEDDPAAVSKVAYIHLEEARYHSVGGSVLPPLDSDGLLWRGRIVEVSGFSLGSFHDTRPHSAPPRVTVSHTKTTTEE